MKTSNITHIVKCRFYRFALCAFVTFTICQTSFADDGRTEISDDMTPYNITNSGSYVLTENLTVTSTTTNGITVCTNNVTIDLNGFTIQGPSGATSLNGIHQSTQYVGLAVHNGTVKRWRSGYGIFCGGHAIFRDLALENNGFGIYAGEGAVVYQCMAFSNGFYGVSSGNGSVIAETSSTYNDRGFSVSGTVLSECSASRNNVRDYAAGDGSVVRRCSSVDSGGDGMLLSDTVLAGSSIYGSASNGITMLSTCAIVDSRIGNVGRHGIDQYAGMLPDYSYGSLIKDCVVSDCSMDGINVWNGSAVLGCNVNGCGDDGIRVFEAFCMLAHNICSSNEAGIHVDPMSPSSGRGSYIKDNTLIDNRTGMFIEGYTNVIVQNVAADNATNWNVTHGNIYHKISNTTNGWPLCNFDY